MDRYGLLATEMCVPMRVLSYMASGGRSHVVLNHRDGGVAVQHRVDAVATRQFESRRDGSALVAGWAFLEKRGDAFEPVRMMQRCHEMIALGAEMCVERLHRRVVE
ncbi:hypothetical protein BLA39750_07336 [Burkholderia lata]|uniref:Uncharacterized protein n=1 Tax=Burkholderia lata (strain ATCC 17760 / DSM 23089 / LMG 22485 / NCIMB 9086 / R18194 / 383) TaxID=482957 RepID=A0A6P3BPS3_BURL3|nr:hypothetical protein BLA39750_07336 [Burkholderia lata]